MMKRKAKALILIGSIVMMLVEAKAAVSESAAKHYENISKRNAFDLKQPLIESKELPPIPIAKIVLKGITTIFGDKRVILKVLVPSKAGEPAKEQSLILAESQSAGEIQVLQVIETTGTVKVNNGGTVMLLTFEGEIPR
jgi:phage/plasmid primase-like uncharacterized protein